MSSSESISTNIFTGHILMKLKQRACLSDPITLLSYSSTVIKITCSLKDWIIFQVLLRLEI